MTTDKDATATATETVTDTAATEPAESSLDRIFNAMPDPDAGKVAEEAGGADDHEEETTGDAAAEVTGEEKPSGASVSGGNDPLDDLDPALVHVARRAKIDDLLTELPASARDRVLEKLKKYQDDLSATYGKIGQYEKQLEELQATDTTADKTADGNEDGDDDEFIALIRDEMGDKAADLFKKKFVDPLKDLRSTTETTEQQRQQAFVNGRLEEAAQFIADSKVEELGGDKPFERITESQQSNRQALLETSIGLLQTGRFETWQAALEAGMRVLFPDVKTTKTEATAPKPTTPTRTPKPASPNDGKVKPAVAEDDALSRIMAAMPDEE